MQQNPQGRRFPDDQQQPLYRFPQNQQRMQGWQPQQTYSFYAQPEDALPVQKDKRSHKKQHHKRKRRIFTLWNLFAVIGIITIIIQGARYVVIPFLVYLQSLTGGVL